MSSIKETLYKFGFTISEADIYIILVENGEMSVSSILNKTVLSRQSVHDALNFLLFKKYIEYRKEGRKAYYKAVHPNKLLGLIDDKKREVRLMEGEMNDTIKTLAGEYNLSLNKPGVRFFEGDDGFAEALSDTLSSKEEIYTFVDMDSVMKYADKINKKYVEERRLKGIGKKLLILDTPENRRYIQEQGSALTDYRILPANIKFNVGTQIYDGKVSYFTLREDNKVAILIEDKNIYEMQRNLFEFLWGMSDPNKKNLLNEDSGNYKNKSTSVFKD